ncbi:hypothetical protein RB195_023237 [Necator americanus]|uniref:Saposin B-type domain-containing protein n=1 Tax=Necator americanus TaxID=51031 RepID=A0ABR1EIY5_NECAM
MPALAYQQPLLQAVIRLQIIGCGANVVVHEGIMAENCDITLKMFEACCCTLFVKKLCNLRPGFTDRCMVPTVIVYAYNGLPKQEILVIATQAELCI